MSKATGKIFEKFVWEIVGGIWCPSHPEYDIVSENGSRLQTKFSNFRKWSPDWNWAHLFGDYDALILGGRFPDGSIYLFDLPPLPIKGLWEKDHINSCNPSTLNPEWFWSNFTPCEPEDLFDRYWL